MEYELQVTREKLEQYLEARQQNGLSAISVPSYRRKLEQLYTLLPEDKTIRFGTIEALGDQMVQEGYSASTANMVLAVADGLVTYFDYPGLQSSGRREIAEVIQPELTRSEYLRLLAAAKKRESAKIYYLVKCFALLGVNVEELANVTVEAAEVGYYRSGKETSRIPDSLARELREYAKREGIVRGPILQGRDGGPIQRPSANKMLGYLAQEARVAPEKCNPRCLRKLYQNTQAELQSRLQFLMDQEYERMLTSENYLVGWDEEGEDGQSFSAKKSRTPATAQV